MASSLFPSGGQAQRAQQVKSQISGRDPDVLFNQMMSTNPQFRSFVEQNRGKTPEQIARENNLDLGLLRSVFH